MRKKKQPITLIEIMIVMFLIALITGVIAYNYRGSLEEGKAFKTKAGIERLQTILNLRVAEDPALLDDIDHNWQKIVRFSPLVHNPESLIKDGWGEEYKVSVEDGMIKVDSPRLDRYRETHDTLVGTHS